MDYRVYEHLTREAAEAAVQASVVLSGVTKKTPRELRQIYEKLDKRSTEGRLQSFILKNPEATAAALSADTKRTLSTVLQVLEESNMAHLASLKNLLITDMPAASSTGAYGELYETITQLVCASYHFLTSCATKERGANLTQEDLGNILHEKSRQFTDILCTVLEGGYEDEEETLHREESTGPAITEESMDEYRLSRRRRVI